MDAETVKKIVLALRAEYPDALCSLEYDKDYELLFSVRLAAQCTDERVNMVTPALYAAYPTLASLAAATAQELEPYIRSCGFYHSKARDIAASARMLIAEYGGKVPGTMEELLRLPGVGRKTANLILGDVFKQPGSVVVDTHCIRITNLLGMVTSREPAVIEEQLRAILPPEESNNFCHRLVLHGRAVCRARAPKCESCCLGAWCAYKHSHDGEDRAAAAAERKGQ